MLRSPAAYADFRASLKQDAEEVNDLIVDQAKSTTQSTLQRMVDDLKAKAAANPCDWRRYCLAGISPSTDRDRANRSWPLQLVAHSASSRERKWGRRLLFACQGAFERSSNRSGW